MDICHNYSEAAESIASSPAVISKHIAKVEKELGLRIFERASKSRPVELTPAGQELITYFHSIVGLYKQMSTRSAARAAARWWWATARSSATSTKRKC